MKKKHKKAKSNKNTASVSSQIGNLPANNYDASRVFMHMAYAAKLRGSVSPA